MTIALIRHPKMIEGQTKLADGFLKVLHLIYGSDVKTIDTSKISGRSKFHAYIVEAVLTALSNDHIIHLLNVNKVLPCLFNALFKKKKVVAYIFSYLPGIHSYWNIKRLFIEGGSWKIIATSKRIADLFNNSTFTYPPLDVDLFKPRDKSRSRRILGLSCDKQIVGYIGDIDESRGFDIAVTVANEIRNSGIKFLVATLRVDSITAKTLNNLKKLKKINSLIFLDRPMPIWHVYNAVDILLLPLHRDYPTEPPVTLLEAISSGTLVVGGNSLSMADYRKLYIPVKEPCEYKEVLTAILGDYRYFNLEYRDLLRSFAVNNFSYPIVADRLRSILEPE